MRTSSIYQLKVNLKGFLPSACPPPPCFLLCTIAVWTLNHFYQSFHAMTGDILMQCLHNVYKKYRFVWLGNTAFVLFSSFTMFLKYFLVPFFFFFLFKCCSLIFLSCHVSLSCWLLLNVARKKYLMACIYWWLIYFIGISHAKGFTILHLLCGYQRQEFPNSILKITDAYLKKASCFEKHEVNKI